MQRAAMKARPSGHMHSSKRFRRLLQWQLDHRVAVAWFPVSIGSVFTLLPTRGLFEQMRDMFKTL
jgi:hypothetical protein